MYALHLLLDQLNTFGGQPILSKHNIHNNRIFAEPPSHLEAKASKSHCPLQLASFFIAQNVMPIVPKSGFRARDDEQPPLHSLPSPSPSPPRGDSRRKRRRRSHAFIDEDCGFAVCHPPPFFKFNFHARTGVARELLETGFRRSCRARI